MLDHPQDAYRLARDHQQNIRNSVEIDRIFHPHRIRNKNRS